MHVAPVFGGYSATKKKTAWIMETYGNQASIQVLGTGAASVWPCSDQQALDCQKGFCDLFMK